MGSHCALQEKKKGPFCDKGQPQPISLTSSSQGMQDPYPAPEPVMSKSQGSIRRSSTCILDQCFPAPIWLHSPQSSLDDSRPPSTQRVSCLGDDRHMLLLSPGERPIVENTSSLKRQQTLMQECPSCPQTALFF